MLRRSTALLALVMAASVVAGLAGTQAMAQSKAKGKGSAQKSDRPDGDAASGPKIKPEDANVTGEIVSLSCYLVEGGHGPQHRACAEACVKDGGPLALLSTRGDAYVIVRDPISHNLDVASYLGKRVQVEGKLFKTTSTGSRALLVEKMKPLDKDNS